MWENEKLGKFYSKEKTIMFDDLRKFTRPHTQTPIHTYTHIHTHTHTYTHIHTHTHTYTRTHAHTYISGDSIFLESISFINFY